MKKTKKDLLSINILSLILIAASWFTHICVGFPGVVAAALPWYMALSPLQSLLAPSHTGEDSAGSTIYGDDGDDDDDDHSDDDNDYRMG